MLLSKKLNLPYTNEKGKFQIVLSGLQLKELDERFIDKEELKEKINNIKKIYDDIEGKEIPGERYTYYETITFAKLHHLLNELLEE